MLFVRVPGQGCLCLDDFDKFPVDEKGVAELSKRISIISGIPLDDFFIGRGNTISINLRLVGGKGGFGSLLKSMKPNQERRLAVNHDAMRDLNGRRLRRANHGERAVANDHQAPSKSSGKRNDRSKGKLNKDIAKYEEETNRASESISRALRDAMKRKPQDRSGTGGGSLVKRRRVEILNDDILSDESDSSEDSESTSGAEEGDDGSKEKKCVADGEEPGNSPESRKRRGKLRTDT